MNLRVEVGPRRASLALGLLIAVTTARAATFYCDPIHRSQEGDGTSARPWRTIHEVIKNVFVNARDGDDNHDDGIQLGQKKNQATGNTVRNNFAHSFDFKADASVQAESNQEVTEAVFNQRLAELARDIDQRFGKRHPTTQRPRLESVPARTSLSDPTLRFTPSPKPYVVLRCGPLTAFVGRVPPERERSVIEMEYFPSRTLAQVFEDKQTGFTAH